jgi:NIPSNAP
VSRAGDLTSEHTPLHRSRPKGFRNRVPAQDLHAALGRGAQAVRQHPLGPPIPTFQGFQVTTHGIWTEHGGNANRLVALISYPNGTDPAELASEVMASPEFAADMEGFDPQNIVAVDSISLDATGCSPIQ